MRRYTMTRSAIWAPGSAFRTLPGEDQLTIMKLSSQGDISAAGVLPLVANRWADQSADMHPDALEASLRRLIERRWIIIDHRTQELFVRNFIEEDLGYTNQKRRAAIASAFREVASPEIRRVLLAICTRLRIPVAGHTAQPDTGTNHTTAPAAGPGRLDGVDAPGPADTGPPDTPPDEAPDTPSDALSDGVSDALFDATSDGGRVVGSKGLYLVPALHNPQPPPPRHAAALPDDEPEEGEDSPERDRLLAEAALADEIRNIRPIWSTKSIRRALRHPEVRERPFEIVAAAIRLVAADLKSTVPGRLRHDGDWWARAERDTRSRHGRPDLPDQETPVPQWLTNLQERQLRDPAEYADRAHGGRARVAAAIDDASAARRDPARSAS